MDRLGFEKMNICSGKLKKNAVKTLLTFLTLISIVSTSIGIYFYVSCEKDETFEKERRNNIIYISIVLALSIIFLVSIFSTSLVKNCTTFTKGFMFMIVLSILNIASCSVSWHIYNKCPNYNNNEKWYENKTLIVLQVLLLLSLLSGIGSGYGLVVSGKKTIRTKFNITNPEKVAQRKNRDALRMANMPL